MKVLSLFDGISCGAVALERAGIPIERYVAYEIDKYAIKISEKNYPMIEHKGDVFEADFTEYNGFDLLIGGSPCTYWSIAKNNRETTPDGIGGQLFMQYVRALRESGCKWFLYENNYSIHQNIKDFISEQLGVQPIMINSALVSAQTRKRCYWTNIPGVEQPQDKGIMLESILVGGGYELLPKSGLPHGELQRSSVLEQSGEASENDGCGECYPINAKGDKAPCLMASYGAKCGVSLPTNYGANNSFMRVAVKVGKQGGAIKPNNGKSLCMLSRDYKGWGNQEMNGVAVRLNNEE